MNMDAEKRRARHRRYYAEKRAEKRCVHCGKQDERTLKGYAYCVKCNAMRYKPYSERKPRSEEQRQSENADKRTWAKMHRDAGVCVQCGRKDKRTINGKGMCLYCATKVNESARKRRAENADKFNKRGKARREAWVADGKCSCCGHAKEEPDKRMCCSCRTRHKMARIRLKIKKGKQPRGRDGWCWQCNNAPVMEGKKLCKTCYDKKMVTIRKSGWLKTGGGKQWEPCKSSTRQLVTP